MNKSNLKKISLPRPIVLVGMMGAGKTSVGRALANLLGVPFFDSDAEIETAAGISVPQIFSDFGEAEFRRMERQVTARLLDSGVCVLSLGGGGYMNEETRARIKEKAFSVWLQVDRNILLERASHLKNRPQLKSGNPKEKMERLLSEREPVYAQADLTVLCDDRPVADNARQIMKVLQAALGPQTA